MYYYQILLLRSSAPLLTYSSKTPFELGSVVSVALKSTTKKAMIVEEVERPTFETTLIDAPSDTIYTLKQRQIAKFISEYYFSSLSEAISLFFPFPKSTQAFKPSLCVETLPSPPTLTTHQTQAYKTLRRHTKALLFGVTGSGKTEIFISLMLETIKRGKTAIFLMPEISLTPQMEKRLKVYFTNHVAMWHSKLTKKRKEQILADIASGEIRIIAGARSALFVPLPDLDLIIIDEEHDDSYKSMTRPRYHARDVAILMGQKWDIKVILASATPSLTSYYKYPVIRLEKPYKEVKKRYKFITGNSINKEILTILNRHYQQQHQSLLFLPTRGNFKYLYCQKCGKTHLCPYCSVGMTLHRKHRHLKCHYCNYTEHIQEQCSYCGHTPLSSERIGTQEAIEEISHHIEGLKIEQFDKDSITTHKKLKDALKRFETKESQLLLGTQMLSKGHDYSEITLCVIMGLDHILGLADYRARERAISLLFQIAGRSGRAKNAEVVIQTANRSFFISYLDDYKDFLEDELVFLETAEYPPFVSLARILISHKEETKATKTTLDIVNKLKVFDKIEIVGHGKAPIERIANKFRFQILLRAKQRVPLLQALHHVNCKEIEIDMDPVEFS